MKKRLLVFTLLTGVLMVLCACKSDVDKANVDEVLEEVIPFEEWACQPDSDEPCLVVWNENGKHELIEPREKYETEEGDILAVPIKGDIGAVYVNTKMQKFYNTEYGKYYEVILENEKWNAVSFCCEDIDYMYTIKNH